MNPVLKGYFFEERLKLLLRLVLMMCYYINNVEKRFLIPNADRFWYERDLRSSDRFLYNYMINLLLYWQSILDEWLRNNTWCIVCARVCMCARCSSYRLIFRKAIMLNLFKVVFPSGLTSVTLSACLPVLYVVSVVNTACSLPVCFKRSPSAACEELATVSIA
jgi:hypothetical protein